MLKDVQMGTQVDIVRTHRHSRGVSTVITIVVSSKRGSVEIRAPDLGTGQALFEEVAKDAYVDMVEIVVLYNGLEVVDRRVLTTAKRVAEIKALKARKAK